MRRILLLVLVVLVAGGCAPKRKEPQCIIKGRVRIGKDPAANAKVMIDICKGLDWLSDTKWETTTDKWGSYKIIIPLDWFSCSYRIRVSAIDTVILKYTDYYGHYDKLVYRYITNYKHGVIKWAVDKKDFKITEKDRLISEDERMKREGLKEKRMND
ncbi:MAG: hypothetical protein PHE49_03260 [bacterium]|nr:hypothetical protein [bacterium]